LHFNDKRYVAYYFRIQIAVICTLVLFILLFRYWPVNIGGERLLDGLFDEDQIIMPEFIETRQEVMAERVAPLVPRPDIVVPEDEVVDMDFDLDIQTAENDTDFQPFPVESGPGEIVENPDRPPNVRRIVEPVTPPGARRDGVRVEVIVRYIVSQNGEVEEVFIEEMRLYNPETGEFESVSETQYGFREITLRAAEQWLFHPATYQGNRVRSVARHRFTYGS